MKSLLRFTQSLGLLLAIAAVFFQTSSALSQTTLVGFNCEVSSTDGNNLTKCGSQLNFNVSFPGMADETVMQQKFIYQKQ